MYSRFTDRARKVMHLASQEAWRYNHEYLGTEHLLLSLARERTGVAAYALRSSGINLGTIRSEVEKIVQPGPEVVAMGKLPQTPRLKRVVELAIEEARGLGHNYVGTEHLLLGLLRENDNVAALILVNLGIKLADVRDQVRALVAGSLPTSAAPASLQDHTPLPSTMQRALTVTNRLLDLLQSTAGARATWDSGVVIRSNSWEFVMYGNFTGRARKVIQLANWSGRLAWPPTCSGISASIQARFDARLKTLSRRIPTLPRSTNCSRLHRPRKCGSTPAKKRATSITTTSAPSTSCLACFGRRKASPPGC